mmetsp:Transcript_22285/g.46783  ORF Transcript_22285/g.46783 Transcript_22285/m.46783 type:complete len:142 (+) Transcript_22285:96-521(+)
MMQVATKLTSLFFLLLLLSVAAPQTEAQTESSSESGSRASFRGGRASSSAGGNFGAGARGSGIVFAMGGETSLSLAESDNTGGAAGSFSLTNALSVQGRRMDQVMALAEDLELQQDEAVEDLAEETQERSPIWRFYWGNRG